MGFRFNASSPIGYTKSGEAIYASKEHVAFVNALLERVGGGSKIGPSTPTGLTYSIEAGGVRLQCNANPAAEEVIAYVWKVGATWDSALLLVNFSSNNELIPSDQVGTYTIWVAAADVRGNYSTPASMSVVVTDADLGIYGPEVTLATSGKDFINGSPASITLTAILLNLPTPTFVWKVNGVIDATATNGTYVVNAFTGASKTIRCEVTSGVSGLTEAAEYVINSIEGDVTATILANSGTSITMTSSNLFKTTTGLGGVFIGSGGLFGKDSGGNTTFSIDGTSGAATFKGDITGASNLSISGTANLDGVTSTGFGTAAVKANGSAGSMNGLVAYRGTLAAPYSDCYAVYGFGQNSGGSTILGALGSTTYGVYGSGTLAGFSAASAIGVFGETTTGTGVKGSASSAGGYGVKAAGSGGAVALRVEGTMEITSTTKVTNLNADLLDGNDSTAFAAASHSHAGTHVIDGTATTYYLYGTQTPGSGVATFDGSAKPGGNTTNAWLRFVINGTTYYVPVWA